MKYYELILNKIEPDTVCRVLDINRKRLENLLNGKHLPNFEELKALSCICYSTMEELLREVA